MKMVKVAAFGSEWMTDHLKKHHIDQIITESLKVIKYHKILTKWNIHKRIRQCKADFVTLMQVSITIQQEWISKGNLIWVLVPMSVYDRHQRIRGNQQGSHPEILRTSTCHLRNIQLKWTKRILFKHRNFKRIRLLLLPIKQSKVKVN